MSGTNKQIRGGTVPGLGKRGSPKVLIVRTIPIPSLFILQKKKEKKRERESDLSLPFTSFSFLLLFFRYFLFYSLISRIPR
jgi:hypothetical protein